MKNWCKYFAAAGLAVAVLGAGITTSPALADPLKDRQATMKDLSNANKVIKAYTEGKGDLKSAVAAAKKIASLAEKLPAMFPKGTGMGHGMKTRAKAEIWKDWDKFKKASSNLVMASSNFANWSRMGDDSTLKSAFGAIGKSCGGCHKPFRGPKPKK